MALNRTVIGNPDIAEFYEFKRLRWKYNENKDATNVKQLAGWGWKRYSFIDGELKESEDGYWAKDPNAKKAEEKKQKEEADLDFDRKHNEIFMGGGRCLRQDDKYYTMEGKLKKDFTP